jgi:hypothetical protein
MHRAACMQHKIVQRATYNTQRAARYMQHTPCNKQHAPHRSITPPESPPTPRAGTSESSSSKKMMHGRACGAAVRRV